MAVIRSKDNPRVRRWQKLARDGAARRAECRAIIEGEKLVEAWLLLRGSAVSVIVSETRHERGGVPGSLKAKEPVVVSEAVMSAITELRTSRGIAAEVEVPVPAVSLAAAGSCVFLEGVQDAGNVGAILRNACAFGVSDVVLGPGCADAWSPKVLRAGAGAHARLNVRTSDDLPASLAEFGGRVLVTVPRDGIALPEADLGGRTGWIFGSEGQGVSAQLARHAQGRVRIPMSENAESLNVAAAAAVCLYEASRRNRQ